MSAELAAVLAAVGAALIGAGPAYIGVLRRTSREGEATRDAITAATVSLDQRITDVRGELRDDIADVRAWQTSHTAEHILLSPPRDPE